MRPTRPTRERHGEGPAAVEQTCCMLPWEGALLLQQQTLKLARDTLSCAVQTTLRYQYANRKALEQLAGHSAQVSLDAVAEAASVCSRVYSPLLYAALSCNRAALQTLARDTEARASLRRRQARAGLTVLEGGQGHAAGRS